MSKREFYGSKFKNIGIIGPMGFIKTALNITSGKKLVTWDV